MLMIDGILILTDLFLANHRESFLFLVLAFFIINMVFFDICKRKVPYEKKGIFYIWQFDDYTYCLIKEVILVLLSLVYFVFWKG